MTRLLCPPLQFWKHRPSPWVSCAVRISLRWPDVWNTHLQHAFHAHVTLWAGMPSFSGFLCPTSLLLCLTLLSVYFFPRQRVKWTRSNTTVAVKRFAWHKTRVRANCTSFRFESFRVKLSCVFTCEEIDSDLVPLHLCKTDVSQPCDTHHVTDRVWRSLVSLAR